MLRQNGRAPFRSRAGARRLHIRFPVLPYRAEVASLGFVSGMRGCGIGAGRFVTVPQSLTWCGWLIAVQALAWCGVLASGLVKIPQSLDVVQAFHPLSFQREKKAGGAGKKRWGVRR